jgi:glyoxylase-like metal-dependent hydrolase (beta-lactamase superfamily II)
MNAIPRRQFLARMGIGAAGLVAGSSFLLPRQRIAAQAGDMVSISALTRFSVGAFEVTVIQDGTTRFEPGIFAANADPTELTALLQAHNLPTTQLNGTFNTTLVNTGDQLALLDTGLGVAQGGGHLIPTLNALGVTVEDITAVIFTHFHPDHIGGGVVDGALAFPNATYHFPHTEDEFLRNVPSGSPMESIVQVATGMLDLAMASEQVVFYEPDAEVIPGINAVATPGHTPGHQALLVNSGNAQLLDIADAALQSVISLQRPDYTPGFDADGALAIETRLALLGRAADEGLQILGYHFPFPGVGYAVRDGDAFRFVSSV